uniref:Transposase n=1 Tax=Acrobeloides nanus TaxID=290746 RepID=A0A914ECQ0_9BILA
MKKRAVLAHYATGRRQIPENAFMLKSSLGLRQSAITGHGMELVLPATVRSSSVNFVKRIWNELPAEVATTHDLRQFKRLIRSREVYAILSIRNVIRKVESNL